MRDNDPDAMVIIANITSRAEAIVIGSMLEARGIQNHIGGFQYGGIYPYCVAIGGYRIWIPAYEFDDASALIREVGLPTADISYKGGRRAVLKFISAWIGACTFFTVPAVIIGGVKYLTLFSFIPLMFLQIPVDPRGRNDFFLAHVYEPE